jgi:hypothetical protein
MKYTLVNEGTKNSMRLQSVGVVLGTPAGSVKKGDFLMWNFGSVYVVNDIVKETEKTIVISESPRGSDEKYERRLSKSRLVCVLS